MATNNELAKLRIQFRQATEKHSAASDAELKARELMSFARLNYFEECEKLKWCPHCDIALAECKGHTAYSCGGVNYGTR